MPRSARIVPDEGVFHVITRGNNRADVFHDSSDFEAYLEILSNVRASHPFKLYHHCLMTNHVHLALETSAGHPLAQIMKKVNLTYALCYKKKYRHVGHFWQDRYKSLLIEKDIYLLACGAYIELNPVKAGLAAHPRDYPYSSFSFYASDAPSILLTPNPLYDSFGDVNEVRRRNYEAFVLARLEDYEAFQKNLLSKRAIGSESFLTSLETTWNVTIARRSRGRPKTSKRSIGIATK